MSAVFIKKLAKSHALFLCILVGGCASFKGDEISPVELPKGTSLEERPSVMIEVRYFYGKSSHVFSQPLIDNNNKLEKLSKSVLESSGLFSQVFTSENPTQAANYKVELSFYINNNQEGAMFSGFISLISAGLIPVAGDDHYEVKGTITRYGTLNKKEYTNKDHITTWIGLWFVPLMASSPEKIASEVRANQIKDILAKMINDGIL